MSLPNLVGETDDMVMSSLPEAMGREGISIPSAGKVRR